VESKERSEEVMKVRKLRSQEVRKSGSKEGTNMKKEHYKKQLSKFVGN
jgi:hypothetical protein